MQLQSRLPVVRGRSNGLRGGYKKVGHFFDALRRETRLHLNVARDLPMGYE